MGSYRKTDQPIAITSLETAQKPQSRPTMAGSKAKRNRPFASQKLSGPGTDFVLDFEWFTFLPCKILKKLPSRHLWVSEKVPTIMIRNSLL
jgi:hypothetical protein